MQCQESWADYEDFIKDFVFENLGSLYSKDTLTGFKMALSEAKKLVATYEQQK